MQLWQLAEDGDVIMIDSRQKVTDRKAELTRSKRRVRGKLSSYAIQKAPEGSVKFEAQRKGFGR